MYKYTNRNLEVVGEQKVTICHWTKLNSDFHFFLSTQKAIKEKNIDLSDIEADVLGTDREKQPPPEKWLLKPKDLYSNAKRKFPLGRSP